MQITPSIQSRLQFQHQTVSELINGYSEKDLKRQPIPGKWSAFENIVHLAVYQPVFHDRVDQILSGKNPSFQRYVADTDPDFIESLQKPLAEQLRHLHDVRTLIFQKITQSTPDQLSLTANHPKFGNLSLVQCTEFFLLHEAHHLFTIFQLVSAKG